MDYNSMKKVITNLAAATALILSATSTQAAETLYYFHNDHLGTPQVMTDDQGTKVWEAHYEPFGEVLISTNTIDNNLRFPGQYYDQESGLHYNYYRDYDPTIGRYTESDLIGVNGGLDTYGYVGGNPSIYLDPYGLWRITIAAYYGWGGGISFGENPNGAGFLEIQGGYGIGGGLSYDPDGTSTNYDACLEQGHLGVGAIAQVGIGFGPFEAGGNLNAGYNVSPYYPFNASGFADGGFTDGFTLQGFNLNIGGNVSGVVTITGGSN
ncbi:MAG: RHS repeat-associated core domain-containing protein [Pseudomonadota bacterium]